jgi:hypothetical protein
MSSITCKHNLLERVAPQEAGLELNFINAAELKKGAEIHSARYVIYIEAIQDTSSQVNLALDPTSSHNCYWIPSLIGVSRHKFFGLRNCILNPYRKLQHRPIDDVGISHKSFIRGQLETCRHIKYFSSKRDFKKQSTCSVPT